MVRIFEIVKDDIISIQTLICSRTNLSYIPRKDERIYLETTKLHYKVKSIVHDVINDDIDICVEI